MGKHVCPICETVFAERGSIKIDTVPRTLQYESWICPVCEYSFISVEDLQDILDKVVEGGSLNVLFTRDSLDLLDNSNSLREEHSEMTELTEHDSVPV